MFSNVVAHPLRPKQTSNSESPFQLSLSLACNGNEKTTISHRYMAYPLSISPVFRSEENGTAASANRAYLYRMNTSPGLLAGDNIGMSLQLAAGAQLYLADQSATKVHTMPQAQATVNNRIDLGSSATLDFLPEPLILFADSQLTQTTEITAHSTAGLSLGEIILPGRLARGEVYEFRQYLSRLRVRSPAGNVWFAETMNLLGKNNRFAQSILFSSGAVLGSLILILPEAAATSENLTALSTTIDALAETHESIEVASSVLPKARGLFVRVMAQTTREVQACFKGAVNAVRELRGQLPLPYSV